MANDKWKIVLRSPAQSPSIRLDLESQSQSPAALSNYRQTYRFPTQFFLRSDRVRCGRAPVRAWVRCARCFANARALDCNDQKSPWRWEAARKPENESPDSFQLSLGRAGWRPIVQRSDPRSSCGLQVGPASQFLAPTDRVFVLPDPRISAWPLEYWPAAAYAPPVKSTTDLPKCARLY